MTGKDILEAVFRYLIKMPKLTLDLHSSKKIEK